MKLLLIDDHLLFARSFQLICKQFKEVDVIDIIVDTIDFSQLKANNYDIILIDLNLENISNENGLVVSQKIKQKFPSIRTVILTGYTKSFYEMRAKEIGISGFIDKNIEPQKLLFILKQIEAGKTFFRDQLLENSTDILTNQEIRILDLSRRGISADDIAISLDISRRTVFNHLNHIYEKLSASNKQEAIFIAEELGYFMDF